MKFIFLTVPAFGHLNPILGIVKELVKRGHKVIIYNTNEFKNKIKETGAEFRLPPIDFPKIDFRIMKDSMIMAETSLYFTKLMVNPCIKILKKEKLDCLIHDSLSLWGKLIGLQTGIPTISFVPSLAINSHVIFLGYKYLMPDFIQVIKQPKRMINIIKEYRSHYMSAGIKPPIIFDIFSNEEKLNIVFTSDYYQPCRKSFGTHYKFVGPIIYDRNEEKLPSYLLKTNKPIIYISFGTVYNDNLEMFKIFINSFKDTQYQVFISLGRYINPKNLGKIPQNMYIRNYLPQLEILKKADLFISHGGMNSVNESLYFDVPMVLFPQIQEQRLNAARVEELGAGIYFKNNVTQSKLLESVDIIFTNSSYKRNAQKVEKTLRNAGGLKIATQQILNYASD